MSSNSQPTAIRSFHQVTAISSNSMFCTAPCGAKSCSRSSRNALNSLASSSLRNLSCFASSPCFVALYLTADTFSGPVDFRALQRFAAITFSETVFLIFILVPSEACGPVSKALFRIDGEMPDDSSDFLPRSLELVPPQSLKPLDRSLQIVHRRLEIVGLETHDTPIESSPSNTNFLVGDQRECV